MPEIFKLTGNQFVDAGIFVMSEWSGKEIENLNTVDILNLASKVADVYITPEWNKALYSLFPNSILIHPRNKSKSEDEKRKMYLDFVSEFTRLVEPISTGGDCAGCGLRNGIKIKDRQFFGKDLIPLSGSAEFVNFYPSAMSSLKMCSACLVAIQFMPIALYNTGGGLFILIQSNSQKIMKFWAKECVRNINKQIATGDFSGPYSKGIGNPVNALFKIPLSS